jgi:hypothetical protein
MSDRNWPSWRFGPNGERAVFRSAEDVPPGWSDSPAWVADAPAYVTPVLVEPVKRRPGRPRKEPAT